MEATKSPDSIYIDYLSEYIDKCSQASNRSRYVLVILVITSILSFISFWNSRQSSWVNLRAKKTIEAYNFKTWKPYTNLKDIKTDYTNYFDAREFATLRDINDSITLKDQSLSLQRQKQDRVNDINISFLGVHFDVNDLGFFSSFTFFVLLLWFKFSLNREFRSIDLTTSRFMNENEQKLVTELLSMHQIFSIPYPNDYFLSRKSVLRYYPLVLFILPLITQLIIFMYDITTYKYGLSLSMQYTVMIYIGNFLLLVINSYNTISCLKIQNNIQKWFISENGE